MTVYPPEGDRTAYYESSQTAIKKNREWILQLRQENKRLHKKLADALAGDERVIKEAFQNRGSEKNAFRNMSGKEALAVLEQEVFKKVKRLNNLRYDTQVSRMQLEELQLQYQRMKPENSRKTQSADAHIQRREEDDRNVRELENKLEKTQLKCQAAEHIMRSYLKLKNHLQEESLTFQGQLDHLEAELLKHNEELRDLKIMNNDAQLSKDAAKAQLQQLEELLQKERKERERIIACYRQQVEERKALTEKIETRAQRAPLQLDELSSEAQRSTTSMGGEEEKASSVFEDALLRIKEATGVTNIKDIVEHFISQGETHNHLEELKVEDEGLLLQLKEEKESLQQQFQDMKYSGETKLSSDQKMLEDYQQHLQAEQRRCNMAKEQQEWLVKTLNTVGSEVEHLAYKLQHIKLDEDSSALPPPDSEEFVVELLGQCEQKLQLLQKELKGKDLAALNKEMEDEEFFAKIEGKLPDYNTRVTLPEDHQLDPFDEEEDSEDDEADVISREELKRQSQLILNSKTKRKPRTRKGQL
ncbi:coiled-coil domain-containing protein 151 [Lampris incognitus]|uniref:coiled-coil domain-containing protein 151 n=1 Tax=Lampris incognitus TaxID=2546036 RepID=UPI0024B58008|nr:coiled-coil domain-containing protein 151 [Lampris incognitus]